MNITPEPQQLELDFGDDDEDFPPLDLIFKNSVYVCFNPWQMDTTVTAFSDEETAKAFCKVCGPAFTYREVEVDANQG